MEFTKEELIKEVPKQNLRAVSRLITLVENRDPIAKEAIKELFKVSGKAHIIGITGAPGAGKSTLVDKMAVAFAKEGSSVAVLAVDPSSPFTGGALLGDRIRMARSLEDGNIYIRSMASRGALGGLSGATVAALQVLDAAKFDVILVETVGVGQGEVDIVKTADTCIVLLVPGMGDGVQAMKAGILEIADIFVINKADKEGAHLLERDLKGLIAMGERDEQSWTPSIVKTVATKGEGISDLIGQCKLHSKWLKESGQGQKRREKNMRENIIKLAQSAVKDFASLKEKELDIIVRDCCERKIDPLTAAEKLFGKA